MRSEEIPTHVDQQLSAVRDLYGTVGGGAVSVAQKSVEAAKASLEAEALSREPPAPLPVHMPPSLHDTSDASSVRSKGSTVRSRKKKKEVEKPAKPLEPEPPTPQEVQRFTHTHTSRNPSAPSTTTDVATDTPDTGGITSWSSYVCRADRAL
jgi:hypothetical protein